jgi:hypothetical protein
MAQGVIDAMQDVIGNFVKYINNSTVQLKYKY